MALSSQESLTALRIINPIGFLLLRCIIARQIITLPVQKVDYTPSGVQSVEIVYTGVVNSLFFDEAAVPQGTTIELASFVVPFSKFDGILRIDVSGQNTAVYDILINGVLSSRVRTSYFNTFASTVTFGNGPGDALTLGAGTTLKIMVTNLGSDAADFEARIEYLET